MSWISFLARKYLASRKRKGIRLVWRLAILGVALGVAILVLTQSVMSGFEKVFKESVLGFNAHLVILKANERLPFSGDESSLGKDFQDQKVAETPFLYREGLLVHRGKVKGGVLKGIDPLTFEKVYDVRVSPLSDLQVSAKIQELLKRRDGTPSIVLGTDLAQELSVEGPEATVKIFLPTGKSGEKLKARDFYTFRVTGIFTSGLHDFDKGFAFVDRNYLQELYGIPGAATGIEYRLKDPMAAEKLAHDLQGRLGMGYEVISWQKLNGPLLKALRTERAVFFVIMTVVVAVAAFNIIGVLLLMILDKTKEISILRALGTSHRGLKGVFGIQGLWIGAMGCFWGLVVGGTLAWFLKKTKILHIAKEVYLVGELPVTLSIGVMVSVVGATLLISFLATQVAVARLKKAPMDL